MNANVEFTHLDEEHIKAFIEAHRGALHWCKRCSRKHRSRVGCNLVPAERIAKSGNIVIRLVHPEKPTK